MCDELMFDVGGGGDTAALRTSHRTRVRAVCSRLKGRGDGRQMVSFWTLVEFLDRNTNDGNCWGPVEAQHLKHGERGHVLAVFKRSAEAVSSRVGGSIDEAEIDSDNTSYMEFHRVDHVARE